MNDIKTVLARWGVWARDHSYLDYPHIASGFKGATAIRRKIEPCCDNDGLIIDNILGNLQHASKESGLELILRHYVYGQSKCAIARLKKCDEREIRSQLQIAERFIDGCITQSKVSLEMCRR